MAAGGAMLVLIAVAVEPGATDVFRGAWGIQAWLGWLFLMLIGSVVAYMIYMRLPRQRGRFRREGILFRFACHRGARRCRRPG